MPRRPDPTAFGKPVSRPASRRAAVTRAAHDLEQLALILEATRKRAEAYAARRVAADLWAVR